MPSDSNNPRTAVQQLLAQQLAAHSSSAPQAAAHAADERQAFPFEADLADHLQLMAEQLSADALHLSQIYPARSPDSWRSVAEQAAAEAAAELSRPLSPANAKTPPREKLLGYSLALCAAVLLCGVTLIVYFSIEDYHHPSAKPSGAAAKGGWAASNAAPSPVPPDEPVNSQTVTQAAPQSGEKVVPALQIAPAKPSVETAANAPVASAAPGPAGPDPVLVPAGLFLTLSAPEQEALLDVMENKGLLQPSVSF